MQERWAILPYDEFRKSKQALKTFRLRKMYIKDPLYDKGNTMQKY